jgi:hypothetical protein
MPMLPRSKIKPHAWPPTGLCRVRWTKEIGRRCHLLLSKRWHRLPPFFVWRTGHWYCYEDGHGNNKTEKYFGSKDEKKRRDDGSRDYLTIEVEIGIDQETIWLHSLCMAISPLYHLKIRAGFVRRKSWKKVASYVSSLFNKRWHRLLPFLSNEPGIGPWFSEWKTYMPGSLDNKGWRRCHLLLNKRWHLIPPFFI